MSSKLKIVLTALPILIVLLFSIIQLNDEKKNEVTSLDSKVTPITVQKPEVNNPIKNEPVKKVLMTKEIKQNVLNGEIIVECDTPVDPDDLISTKYFDEKTIELTNNTEKLAQVLELSVTMESQITHALITGSDDETKISDKFKALNSEYPDNALLSYDLLSSCISSDSLCERSVIDDGIALDSQNGAVWLLSALYELNNNNIERATEALLEASSAPIYDEYWGEHFSLFELAFSQTGASNELPTQIATMSYVASIPLPSFGILVEFCKNTEITRADILDACLKTGERLANAKGTMISHLIGLSLQKAVYKKYNADAQVSQISNKRKEFNRTMSLSNKANNLVWQSSQRTSDWIQQNKDFGEVGAIKYIVDDAIQLSSDPNFDPCEINW